MAGNPGTKGFLDPHIRLRNVVSEHIERCQTGENSPAEEALKDLLDSLPRKWHRMGDLILFPAGSFSSKGWQHLLRVSGKDLWRDIAEALYVNKVGVSEEVDTGPMRQSRARLLLGEDGWVEHKEGGVIYTFDAAEVMFSKGNVGIRKRAGDIDAKGEVVVDLFCGIGYYTLPILVNGKAGHVHACEMNSDSIEALQRGLILNGVESNCTIHAGDNQHTAKHLSGIADRVFLGLLPSSERAWPLSVNCLKPEGGVIHVHQNVEEYSQQDLDKWELETVARFSELAKTAGKNWQVSTSELVKVKWYCPHVRHVVLTLKIVQE